MTERVVVVRPARRDDRLWLLADGLAPAKVGEQYHWAEAPLQLYSSPARAWRAPDGPAAIIEVDGRRAGYIGPNPISQNLEYWVDPWARGGGVGSTAIAAYLRDGRSGDRPRRFFVAKHNERSLRALRRAMAGIGWTEGRDFRVVERDRNWWIRVGPGRAPAEPART